ncbi:hypothetical protein Avbf_04881 [Armadillidium vulgare]|nr:hypothetical protein Avbf_04881 [Armadillidium vulgare]
MIIVSFCENEPNIPKMNLDNLKLLEFGFWNVSDFYLLTETFSLNRSSINNCVFGAFLGEAPLKEGDDVYFSCKIDANPPVSLIQWFHEINENTTVI